VGLWASGLAAPRVLPVVQRLTRGARHTGGSPAVARVSGAARRRGGCQEIRGEGNHLGQALLHIQILGVAWLGGEKLLHLRYTVDNEM
jgi:hypothetical protein